MPDKIDLLSRDAELTLSFPLGRDYLGRNLLLRLQEASWITIGPVWGGVAIAFLFGILLTWYFSAKHSDSSPSRLLLIIAMILSAIPVSIVALFFSVLNDSISLSIVIAAMSIFVLAHVFLATTNQFKMSKRLAYWQAHQAIGGSLTKRFYFYGVFGDWGKTLTQLACFYLAIAVTTEASLSYLGFGVQEPTASFGNIFSAHLNRSLMGHFQVTFFTVAALCLVLTSPISLLYLVNKTFSRRAS